MNRVKDKIEAENDKKQTLANQKWTAPDHQPSHSRPQQRRRSSQQKGGSGASGLPLSPSTISPTTSTYPILSAATGSPTSTFTPAGVNGTKSFTPQSQSGSSPGGSELIYPFAMGQGMYTPFGNSPPLFSVSGQNSNMLLPSEMVDVTREDDGSGQFWQSLFGPSGNLIPPPSYGAAFPQPGFASAQGNSMFLGRATGEFRDPNDTNIDTGGENNSTGVNLDDIDTGLVDWGDFIAQCSQVWVTE